MMEGFNLKRYYVCSPVYAPTMREIKENIRRAEGYVREVSNKFNCWAVTPAVYIEEITGLYNPPSEYLLSPALKRYYIKDCKALIVCGDRINKEMLEEIEIASALNIPVYILDGSFGELNITVDIQIAVE